MGQFSGQANSTLFNTSQTVPNAPLIPNMSAAMASQSLLPRMQFALSGGNAQRAHSSQILNDQMFNLGTSNTVQQQQQQQQQHGSQGAFGAISQNPQNLQANMVAALQNAQHHPNFQQQRPQNQQ
ncbi:Mediator of RNA polymerase II transcription subunit 8-like protein [Drosera capensis]